MRNELNHVVQNVRGRGPVHFDKSEAPRAEFARFRFVVLELEHNRVSACQEDSLSCNRNQACCSPL